MFFTRRQYRWLLWVVTLGVQLVCSPWYGTPHSAYGWKCTFLLRYGCIVRLGRAHNRKYRIRSWNVWTIFSTRVTTLLATNLPSRYESLPPHYILLLNRRVKTPVGYHYADRPSRSVDRVRRVVFENFDISMISLRCQYTQSKHPLIGSGWWSSRQWRSSCNGHLLVLPPTRFVSR